MCKQIIIVQWVFLTLYTVKFHSSYILLDFLLQTNKDWVQSFKTTD